MTDEAIRERAWELSALDASKTREERRDAVLELVCAAVGDMRAERDELQSRYDALRKRRGKALPEGCVWPEFEDGSKVRVGDECGLGAVREITFEGGGFRLVADSGLRVSGEMGERISRPRLLAADGLPIEVGQTLYGEDGRVWEVGRIDHGHHHPVKGTCGGVERDLRPEWLTHERPDSFERIIKDAIHEGMERHMDNYMGRGERASGLSNAELVGRIEKLAGKERA